MAHHLLPGTPLGARRRSRRAGAARGLLRRDLGSQLTAKPLGQARSRSRDHRIHGAAVARCRRGSTTKGIRAANRKPLRSQSSSTRRSISAAASHSATHSGRRFSSRSACAATSAPSRYSVTPSQGLPSTLSHFSATTKPGNDPAADHGAFRGQRSGCAPSEDHVLAVAHQERCVRRLKVLLVAGQDDLPPDLLFIPAQLRWRSQ
jgi:hypothetical protein